MEDTVAISRIKTVYQSVGPLMDERARRHWAAAEARAFGRGGIRALSGATTLSPNTIWKAPAELGTAPVTSRRPPFPDNSTYRAPDGLNDVERLPRWVLRSPPAGPFSSRINGRAAEAGKRTNRKEHMRLYNRLIYHNIYYETL
jgi:hypothetical protein